jgi:hypothetical protein
VRRQNRYGRSSLKYVDLLCQLAQKYVPTVTVQYRGLPHGDIDPLQNGPTPVVGTIPEPMLDVSGKSPRTGRSVRIRRDNKR